jgi:hypothetical protein
MSSKTILKAPWFLDTNYILNWQHKVGGSFELGEGTFFRCIPRRGFEIGAEASFAMKSEFWCLLFLR